MPVLFAGHGSPMNAIEDDEWSRGFRALTALLPRPEAILAISAHWYVPRHVPHRDRAGPESAFDADVARALTRALEGEAGRTSHPTPDHYLPLVYTVGIGFDMGSLSMRAVLFG